jgi:hypothetical protein
VVSLFSFVLEVLVHSSQSVEVRDVLNVGEVYELVHLIRGAGLLPFWGNYLPLFMLDTKLISCSLVLNTTLCILLKMGVIGS